MDGVAWTDFKACVMDWALPRGLSVLDVLGLSLETAVSLMQLMLESTETPDRKEECRRFFMALLDQANVLVLSHEAAVRTDSRADTTERCLGVH